MNQNPNGESRSGPALIANRKSRLTIAGLVLLLSSPLLNLAGALYVYFAPRVYYSEAQVEIRGSQYEVQKEIATVGENYSRSIVSHWIRQTDLYAIGMYERDPVAAEIDANAAAKAVVQYFSEMQKAADLAAHATPTPWVSALMVEPKGPKIWELAELDTAPARPRVEVIMFGCTAAGSSLALAGGLLLFVSWRRSLPDRAPSGTLPSAT